MRRLRQVSYLDLPYKTSPLAIDIGMIRTRQARRQRLIAAGLVVCLLALVPLLAGLVYEVGYFGAQGGFMVAGGGLGLHLAPFPSHWPPGSVVKPAESDYLLLPYIGRNASNGFMVLLPLWPLVVAGAAGAMLVRRYYGRVLPGHCRECGYDLTGNTSGRCPKCGNGVVTSVDGLGAVPESPKRQSYRDGTANQLYRSPPSQQDPPQSPLGKGGSHAED